MRNTTRHWSFRILAPLRPAALAAVALQGFPFCEKWPQKIPGVTPHIPSCSHRLDAAIRWHVLTEAAAAIRDLYAALMCDTLAAARLGSLEQGRTASVTDADSLVAVVMAVIRSGMPDRRFGFPVRRQPESHAEPSRLRVPSRHGLRTVRTLEHGIAILEFDGLPRDSVPMRVVKEALAALPEVRALVCDIRRNIGGLGDVVVQACGHLLEARGPSGLHTHGPSVHRVLSGWQSGCPAQRRIPFVFSHLTNGTDRNGLLGPTAKKVGILPNPSR